MKKPKTQKEAIILHLEFYGHITSLVAIREYGITRLSHWIHVLRNEGWSIKTLDTKSKNRFGHTVVYATYKLIEQPKEK